MQANRPSETFQTACLYGAKAARFAALRRIIIPLQKSKLIPVQKSKLTRRRAADSTTSTARRDNEVRLFFWIGITRRRAEDSTPSTARRANEVRLFFWIGIMKLLRPLPACAADTNRQPATHPKPNKPSEHQNFRRPVYQT